MYRTILVPLDGSDMSRRSIPTARALVRAVPGNRILLLRVVEGPLAETSAREYLATVAREVDPTAGNVQLLTATGEPVTEILRAAHANEVDMIAMTTHAHGSHSIAALTSVAEQVLAKSDIPVVLAGPEASLAEDIHTLLVPVDGQPGGALALAAAIALARQTSARIVLVSVVVPVDPHSVPQLPIGVYIDPVWERLARWAAEDYTRGLARRLREVGVAAEARVVAGDVATEIFRSAHDVDADVVVMSTHTMAWPGQAYGGSVASRVVLEAQRPVLLIHREAPPAHTPRLTRVTAAGASV